MPRTSQILEIDLRSGIVTNESVYAIGPRLQSAQNVAWDYPFPRNPSLGTYGPWLTRQPTYFPTASTTTFTGAQSFRDIGFSGNGSILPNGVLLIGCNGSDQYSAWASDGSVVPFAGGVTRATVTALSSILGCAAYWDTPGNDPNGGAAVASGIGMAVFSHRFASHVYYLLDDGAAIRSLTTDTTNCPAGAAALAVHLDRLWLGKGGYVYYTDPLNADSIRTTNVLRTYGDVRCLVPGQLGTIDASGVPHLIIGTANGVQVLDGDPQLGGGLQADMRILLSGVGMASSHVAATTPHGTYFLATDGNLWRIPPGAAEAQAVGDPIRNRLGINGNTGAIDQDGTATGSVVYFHPYLYLFPGGETSEGVWLAEPTREGVGKFWGPLTLHSAITGGRRAIVRSPADSAITTNLSLHAPSGAYVPSVHSVDMAPSSAAARYLTFDQRTTTHKTNRTPLVQTGLLNVPGHAIQVTRILLESVKVPQVGGADVTWTVTVRDEKSNSVTATRLPESVPAAGIYANSDNVTQHFVVPALPAARGVSIQVAATAGADLALQRAFAEVHLSPAQF